MLPKTGLLILSNPKKVGEILANVQKYVKNTLYIQFLSGVCDPFGSFHPKVYNTWPKFSQTIFNIYSQAATFCCDVDVRILLSGIKYNIPKIQTQKPIDLVIFDQILSVKEIDDFVKTRVQNITKDCNTFILSTDDFKVSEETTDNDSVCCHAVLGGTFDRLHIAHKILLSEAALRAKEKVTVGITNENMLQSKELWELIQDLNVRIKNVLDFLKDICPELEYNVVPISDPFGPAIVDPSMDLIVVSKETLKGGEKINELRLKKLLNPLLIAPVELVADPNPSLGQETKISSSTIRMTLLGTVLKPIEPNNNIPRTPYVIGLTGGIASGKSGVAKWLFEFGALVINCDTVAHYLYKPGMPVHHLIVSHFGDKVLAANGEVDRRVLGGIVFGNKDQLEKLNSLVWPALTEEVNNIITTTDKKVVIVEAAVLLKAGWDEFCHEVWATITPPPEAIKRLMRRNGLTEQQAKERIDSQPPNIYYVQHANVVFCPLWPPEQTKEQVAKAWKLLQDRLLS